MNTAASPKADAPAAAEDASLYAPSWYAWPPTEPPSSATDRKGLLPTDSLWRSLMQARAIVASSLSILLAVAWWRDSVADWVPAVGLAWTALCLSMVAQPRLGAPGHLATRHWLSTVWADLAAISALQLLTPTGPNLTPLFIWPVLLAAVTGPRLLALGSAAAGTIAVLAATWINGQGTADTSGWIMAALTGVGLFLIALLANQLALNLGHESATAQRNEHIARLHARINRRIVSGLTEGIVVTDARALLWWANPAAAHMLGSPHTEAQTDESRTALHQLPGWRTVAGITRGVLQTLAGETIDQPITHDVTLPLPSGGQRRVRLRIHPVAPQGRLGAAVIFMEDLQLIEQRLHTERLAAMGRVSAAVAHEIRNPLAAIAQASALLLEEDLSPTQYQLLTLIEQNARRIDRTVTDVLEAAHAPAPGAVPPAIALDATVDAIVADWLRQRPQGERLLCRAGAPDARVAFDPEHLRRVLVNLLDNADRHASAAPASLRVETALDGANVRLTVWNDGPEIPAAVRTHLFEPFVSSQSRSSGLGLYLSRELCQRYHASLTYTRAQRDGRWGHAFEVQAPAR